MTNTDALTNDLTNALVAESKEAWAAGAQNCPGPMSEDAARRAITAILEAHGLVTRPCNCGSGVNNDLEDV